MSTQSSDIPFLLKEAEQLIGFTVTRVVTDDDNEFFGLRLEKGEEKFNAWIDRDAETNGPGWLNIEVPTI